MSAEFNILNSFLFLLTMLSSTQSSALFYVYSYLPYLFFRMIRQRLLNRLLNTRRESPEVIRVELRYLIAIAALIRIFIGVSVDRSLLVVWITYIRDPWSLTRYRGRYSSLYLRNRYKSVILDLIISFIVTRYIHYFLNRLRGVITRQIDL